MAGTHAALQMQSHHKMKRVDRTGKSWMLDAELLMPMDAVAAITFNGR